MEVKCSCGKRLKVKCVKESNKGGKMCLKENDMSFKREERYTVIKHNQLTDAQMQYLKDCIFGEGIPTVGCVVVESDWPEYETVWKMIEERVK